MSPTVEGKLKRKMGKNQRFLSAVWNFVGNKATNDLDLPGGDA